MTVWSLRGGSLMMTILPDSVRGQLSGKKQSFTCGRGQQLRVSNRHHEGYEIWCNKDELTHFLDHQCHQCHHRHRRHLHSHPWCSSHPDRRRWGNPPSEGRGRHHPSLQWDGHARCGWCGGGRLMERYLWTERHLPAGVGWLDRGAMTTERSDLTG